MMHQRNFSTGSAAITFSITLVISFLLTPKLHAAPRDFEHRLAISAGYSQPWLPNISVSSRTESSGGYYYEDYFSADDFNVEEGGGVIFSVSYDWSRDLASRSKNHLLSYVTVEWYRADVRYGSEKTVLGKLNATVFRVAPFSFKYPVANSTANFRFTPFEVNALTGYVKMSSIGSNNGRYATRPSIAKIAVSPITYGISVLNGGLYFEVPQSNLSLGLDLNFIQVDEAAMTVYGYRGRQTPIHPLWTSYLGPIKFRAEVQL